MDLSEGDRALRVRVLPLVVKACESEVPAVRARALRLMRTIG